jgi:tryptophan 2,3-dioxygenase
MAPTDFLDFRGFLSTASGFQSLQFRIIENKLGLSEVLERKSFFETIFISNLFLKRLRIKFNQQNYDYLFTDNESREQIKDSTENPSLLKLIEAWLERTPGLVIKKDNENGNQVEINHFRDEYEKAVHTYLKESYLDPAEVSKRREIY